MFGRERTKEPVLSDAIRTYLERITVLEQRVTALELNENAFRDKVLRKIQKTETDVIRPKIGQSMRVK